MNNNNYQNGGYNNGYGNNNQNGGYNNGYGNNNQNGYYGGGYNDPNSTYGGYNDPNSAYGGYNDPNSTYGSYDPNSTYGGYNDQYNNDFQGYGGNSGFNGNYSSNMQYTSASPMGTTSTGTLADFTRKVYGWMFIGLAITFGIGIMFLFNKEQSIYFIVQHLEMFYMLALVEVALVFILSFFVAKMPPVACTVVFLAYSVVNGLTIAPALLAYGAESAFMALAATGCIFGAMSIYGMVTKKDLSSWGTVLLFGLFGLIIYSVIAMLFQMPMSDLIISLVGVIIFTAFTAYDTQKIKKYYAYFQDNYYSRAQNGAIVAALELYLDFINLFLYILRLFARSRR